ncbi:MAG TPA: 3-deoxy-D-manno-octulosonic acid transferase [Candidatus Deferrimicrobiaceae bacterium]
MTTPFRPGSPGHVLYNAAIAAALLAGAPLWIPWVLSARKRRKNFPERLGLRGLPSLPSAGNRPRVWVHAVSVGETLAAAPLLRKLRELAPDAQLLLSNVTLTGREIGEKALGDVVDAGFYFPFDIPRLCGRFLDRLRPDVVVIVETEIWPNFLAACAARGIPPVIVNGRLSERSFRGYLRLRWFFAPVLRTFRAISAQSREDAGRFVELGAPGGIVSVGGNLKFDLSPPEPKDNGLSALLAGEKSGGVLWVVAGSTHEGEEEAVLRAFLPARNINPALKLLLAPRHPERFGAVEALLTREGIESIRRSALPADTRATGAPVVLLDSVGELAGAYAAADLAFVGGSLVPKGGHNVLEPAGHGVPTLVGPHMENFREIAATFLSAGALLQVSGEGELAERFARFAGDPKAFRETGRRARELFESFHGASERNARVVLAAIGRGGDAA